MALLGVTWYYLIITQEKPTWDFGEAVKLINGGGGAVNGGGRLYTIQQAGDMVRMNSFNWAKVLQVSFHKDKFYIQLRPTEASLFFYLLSQF